MFQRKSVAGALCGLATLATLTLIPATTASATADRVCSSRAQFPAGGGVTVTLPVWKSSNHSTDCFLAQGDYSNAVRALQTALAFCNGSYYKDNIDGDFGPHTYAALRSAQAYVHVHVDGIYGNQTRNALKWPNNDTIYPCTKRSHY